jgi:O-antigen/teichoic acid export membrane protein
MMKFINKIFIKLFTLFYEKILHEKMSDEMAGFLKNFLYVGLGSCIAMIFSFSFNILAGRILGPSGYGELALLQSVAMFLVVPMLFGYSYAMTKYNSEKNDLDRQQNIISTTYILIFIFTIVSIFMYFLFSFQLSRAFSVSVDFFYLSVIFTVSYLFYTLTSQTLLSLHEIKKYAVILPISSIIVLSVFLSFIFIDSISFESAIYSMILAYAIAGGIMLVFLRKYLRFKFNKSWGYLLTKYSNYALIGGIAAMFYSNIDKIFINMFMAVDDVGIYRAYQYSFTMGLMVGLSIFRAIFFPYASKSSKKNDILKKINRFIPFVMILGLPFTIGFGWIVLQLYGGNYPFDFMLALLFGIVTLCYVLDQIYGTLMDSVGIKAKRIVALAAIVMAIANISLNYSLIPLLGIEGAIVASIISYSLSIGIILSRIKYVQNAEVVLG